MMDFIQVVAKLHKKRAALSFNELFKKSPAKSSFIWSVFVMDKGECRRSTEIYFGDLYFS